MFLPPMRRRATGVVFAGFRSLCVFSGSAFFAELVRIPLRQSLEDQVVFPFEFLFFDDWLAAFSADLPFFLLGPV